MAHSKAEKTDLETEGDTLDLDAAIAASLDASLGDVMKRLERFNARKAELAAARDSGDEKAATETGKLLQQDAIDLVNGLLADDTTYEIRPTKG